MALTRDVPFSKYGEDEATVAAAGIMYISAYTSCSKSQGATSPYLEVDFYRRELVSLGDVIR